MVLEADTHLVEQALAGDSLACESIRSPEMSRYLESLCIKRGASSTEAGDLVADLLADCFGGSGKKPPLLLKYTGKGALKAFLGRAAINRLIDLKRRQRFQGDLPASRRENKPTDEFDLLESNDLTEADDDALTDLLRDALVKSMENLDPLHLLLLQLVAVHQVNQTRAGEMLGWSQSKVSRALKSTMEQLREDTLTEVHRVDPWLDLQWSDFLSLCQKTTDLFMV